MAITLSFLFLFFEDAAMAFVCVRRHQVVHDIVSDCKLGRYVAGWNPIRVHCQVAAALTWNACCTNLEVKNKLLLNISQEN